MVAQRVPVKIRRKPILLLSKKGHTKYGGWFVFNKPKDQETPKFIKPKVGKYRILWCPYCGEWTLFRYNYGGYDRYDCQGTCGWAHTDEYYVKNANDLWWEGVSLSDMKKVDISITRPQARRK